MISKRKAVIGYCTLPTIPNSQKSGHNFKTSSFDIPVVYFLFNIFNIHGYIFVLKSKYYSYHRANGKASYDIHFCLKEA